MFHHIDTSHFMPHGHCILWKPELLFPIVFSDILVFLSYMSIPVLLFIFLKNRTDLPDNTKKIIYLFIAFILLCGITHLISAYNYWHSEYVIEMYFKVATGLVSMTTAIVFFSIRGELIKIPTPTEYQKLNQELIELNQGLEAKVLERTRELKEQKNILLTILKGTQGKIVSYHPISSDGEELVDFSSEEVMGNISNIDEFEGEAKILSESVKNGETDLSIPQHLESAISAYKNNTSIIEDPIYNPRNQKFYRAVLYKNSELNHLLVYYSDVTLRERAKTDFLTNSKLAAMGEMAGSIAHEINTPLQVLSGLFRSIKRSLSESDRVKTQSEFENSTVIIKKISDIINNLKQLSRSDVESLKPIKLKPVLEKIFSLYNRKFENEKINFSHNLNSLGDTQFMGNEITIFQIFSNIFNNAIDALEQESKKEISLNIQTEKNKIGIKIMNNGDLISEEDKIKIFDPLFTTKQIGKGTGLGLSLSKRLANKINADISLEQSEQVCFLVTLERAV